MARVLIIEPFHAGSHRAFVDGLMERSGHRIVLLTHPGRFWKWRMRGAAVTLADQTNALRDPYDVILASDMLSVAEYISLLDQPAPVVLYMHENQLAYQVPPGETIDVQFGFTNITSCLAADVVLFNSGYHYRSFFSALPSFLRQMPDCRPTRVPPAIQARSRVMYPGVDLNFFDDFPRGRHQGPPVILWNHRWEFDKRPDIFFAALDRLVEDGLDFRLIVCGEDFRAMPKDFISARERLADRILHFGFAKERAEYAGLLKRSDIVVSTAVNENFGIAVVEAIYCGAYPVLPRGLSYPELLPENFHGGHLYGNFDELVLSLKKAIKGFRVDQKKNNELAQSMLRFDWSYRIHEFDSLLEEVCEKSKAIR